MDCPLLFFRVGHGIREVDFEKRIWKDTEVFQGSGANEVEHLPWQVSDLISSDMELCEITKSPDEWIESFEFVVAHTQKRESLEVEQVIRKLLNLIDREMESNIRLKGGELFEDLTAGRSWRRVLHYTGPFCKEMKGFCEGWRDCLQA